MHRKSCVRDALWEACRGCDLRVRHDDLVLNLRVVTLADEVTILNAFPDRGFKP